MRANQTTHPKRVTVWCGLWSRDIIGHFSSKLSQSTAIVIGPRWTLATFGFNRTVLRATQPKLHSMFCALFLKIALSAAELISFGHLGAVIWHCWTIICWVPPKISVAPTSQGQLSQGQYSWSHWWNIAAHNR